MVFNEEERHAAKNITINNYIGHIEHSNFQQGMTNSMNVSCADRNIDVIESLIAEIKKILPKMENEADREEVSADIATIEHQLKSPKPKIGMVHELLKSVRNILEGTAGSLLASSPAIAEGFRILFG